MTNNVFALFFHQSTENIANKQQLQNGCSRTMSLLIKSRDANNDNFSPQHRFAEALKLYTLEWYTHILDVIVNMQPKVVNLNASNWSAGRSKFNDAKTYTIKSQKNCYWTFEVS